MDKKTLYEYLTNDRGVSREQEKLIENAVNYCMFLKTPEEQVAFLSTMLKDVYSAGEGPELTVEMMSGARKKSVRIWKDTRQVITQTRVNYLDIECNADATEEEIIEYAKFCGLRWNNKGTIDKDRTEEATYRVEDAEDIIRKEKEKVLNTLVLAREPGAENIAAKRFGDLHSGDMVFRKSDGKTYQYVVSKSPVSRKYKKADFYISAFEADDLKRRSLLRPDDLAQPEEEDMT